MVESSSESVADNYMYVCQLHCSSGGACWLPVVHVAVESKQ